MDQPTKTPRKRRSVFRRPLAAIGSALVIAGGFTLGILLLIDLTSATDNPYRSLVTFVGTPLVIVLGVILFGISVLLQVRRAKKRGEPVRLKFQIDPSDPRYVKNVWLFLAVLAVLVFVIAYSGSKAYEATDSVGFCGETCHVVMKPQNVTYHNSPHARVPCVECHIGPGASFYVKSKLDGIRQLLATVTNSYDRPIKTPVHSLRPAQETCEGCHWPQQFYGQKMVTHTYYRTDEDNSPWTIKLLVKIGGGNPRTGGLEGIHWHMLGENKVEYIATDDKRQTIPWVRMTKADGEVYIYTDPNANPADLPDPDDPLVEVREFDCMDCHNRPSHSFQPPAKSMNLALSTRRISTDLPFIRQVGLDLLNADYPDTEEAMEGIRRGVVNYYEENYPDLAETLRAEIEEAGKAMQTIYTRNFFPEMKTDYRARENNLSHFVNDGCFRCHDGIKETQWGEKLSHDCNTCHLIVAQGPSDDDADLESSIAGLEFKHPEDIDGAWKEMICTECHDKESGY